MYVGLDLGTSGLRGLMVDETGQPIGSADASYDVMHPHLGWSEQDPKDWIDALGLVFDSLKSNHAGAFSQIKGIGISGHMHGAT